MHYFFSCPHILSCHICVAVKQIIVLFCRIDANTLDLAQAFQVSEEKKNIVLIGCPGSGKSSLALYLAMLWGEQVLGLNSLQTNGSIPEVLKQIKLLLYIRPQDYQDTLEDTARKVLQKCCGASSDRAFGYYKLFDKVGIIFDSLDEIKNWKESQFKRDVFNLMDESRTRVITGVRRGHPVMDTMYGENHFKFLQVDGFDEADIFEYIDRFFHALPGDHGELVEKLKDIVRSSKRLTGLLVIPLTLAMLCILLADEEITIEEVSSIQRVDIYTKMQHMMFIRDNDHFDREEIVKKCDSFHKYVLLCLMENADMYEVKMKEFVADPGGLPFITFGDEKLGQPWGRRVLFPHKSFEEVSGSKFVSDCNPTRQISVMAYLAVNRELYNVLEIIIESVAMSEKTYEIIINMVLCVHMKQESEEEAAAACSGCCSQTIERLKALGPRGVLENELDPDLIRSFGNVRPCSKCWIQRDRRLEKGWQVNGLNTAIKFIEAIPDTSIQVSVFGNTICRVLSEG